MITKEKVEEAIAKLQMEEATLKASHQRLISDHQNRTQMVQQAANANLSRLQQITGAIANLKMLLNGEHPPEPEQENKP